MSGAAAGFGIGAALPLNLHSASPAQWPSIDREPYGEIGPDDFPPVLLLSLPLP